MGVQEEGIRVEEEFVLNQILIVDRPTCIVHGLISDGLHNFLA